MSFLLKLYVLSIVVVIVECTTDSGQHQRQQCLSSDSGNMDKCDQDLKQMSSFVAGLVDVGRFTTTVVDEDEKVKVQTKSNVLTLLIRAASGVIGRGADAMKSLIVSSLMLLTRTILKVSEYRGPAATVHRSKFVSGSRPIDWILNNPYIASMTGHAVDGTLTDRLDRMASGMPPCVRLFVCRLSPIVSDMQRRVREDERHGGGGGVTGAAWNVSDWRRHEEAARICANKHRDCAAAAAGRD